MKTKKIKIILFSLLFLFLCLPAYAGGLGDAFSTGEDAPLGNVAEGAGYDTSETGINPIIQAVIQVLLSFLGVIFLILVIYGGFLWMTASGNEEQIGKAKKILKSAIVGLIIVMAAYAISWFVIGELGERMLDENGGTEGGEAKAIIQYYS